MAVTWDAGHATNYIVLTEGNLTVGASQIQSSRPTIRATEGKTAGKWYFEVELNNNANNYSPEIGILDALFAFVEGHELLGSNDNGYRGTSCYLATGQIGRIGDFQQQGLTSCVAGDVVGVAVDMDNGTVKYYKNGTQIGSTVTGISSFPITEAYPAISIYPGQTASARFKDADFTQTVPAGYSAWEEGAGASDESWLLTLANGVIEGLKSTAKSAIPYYDGNKFVMKESAGAAGKMLTLDSNGDLAWVDIPSGSSAATETAAGIAELATQAEVTAGTDASRIVTPATLQGRIGANSGIAPLDAGGKVPTANLPSMGGEVTISVPASESLATGDMVNLWTDSGTVKARKASCTISNDIVKECHGFAESAVTSGNTATVKISGTMSPTVVGGSLTPGAYCYVHNETFAGYVTHSAQTTQGYYNQIVGLAITSTTMLFKPQRARIIKGV